MSCTKGAYSIHRRREWPAAAGNGDLDMTSQINLSKKARASITLKDFGANSYWSYETNRMETQRIVAVCADICGETMPIWYVDSLGM